VGRAASQPGELDAEASFEQRAAAEHAEGIALLSRSAATWVGALALLVLLA